MHHHGRHGHGHHERSDPREGRRGHHRDRAGHAHPVSDGPHEHRRGRHPYDHGRPGGDVAPVALGDAAPATALLECPAYSPQAGASSLVGGCPKRGGSAVCDGDCRSCPERGR